MLPPSGFNAKVALDMLPPSGFNVKVVLDTLPPSDFSAASRIICWQDEDGESIVKVKSKDLNSLIALQ